MFDRLQVFDVTQLRCEVQNTVLLLRKYQAKLLKARSNNAKVFLRKKVLSLHSYKQALHETIQDKRFTV